jgi:hypothetical protein
LLVVCGLSGALRFFFPKVLQLIPQTTTSVREFLSSPFMLLVIVFVSCGHLFVFTLIIIFMKLYQQSGCLDGLTDKDLSLIGYAPRSDEIRTGTTNLFIPKGGQNEKSLDFLAGRHLAG